MPNTRIDQLKKVIALSKRMDYKMGKGDALPTIIEQIEANINDENILNYDLCYELFGHIMEHQGYLANTKKTGDNNIMIAYALLSALDGELAKNVKEKINKENVIGLNLYNNFGRDPFKDPIRKSYMEEGPEQDKKYEISHIDRNNYNDLEVSDLRKIENIRNLYEFLNKQGKSIFHTNTPEYEAMCEYMKRLIDYVDTAKDGIDKAVVNKGLDQIATVANTYISTKLGNSNYEGPKSPRGKARFAAAFAALKTIKPNKADSYIDKLPDIKDKFGNKLVDAVMKKSAATKLEVKPRAPKPAQPKAEEPVQAKDSEPVAAETQEIEKVDVNPLIEEVKEPERYTKQEAIKRLREQLDDLQKKINVTIGSDKWNLMAEYVVVNEIKNQVIIKGDDEVIDKFNIDKNKEQLAKSSEFGKVVYNDVTEDIVDMKEFCKTLSKKMAEYNKDTVALDRVAENAFIKTEVKENKVEENKVPENKVPEKKADVPAMG